MFQQYRTAIASKVIVGLVVATLGLGLAGTGTAFARDNRPGAEGTGCVYQGKEYSEGSWVRMEGKLMKCVRGEWVEYTGRIFAKSFSSTASNQRLR
jgi:hypothetical protein